MTSLERVFSTMNIIKSCLRNKIGDDFMNNCLIAYIECDIINQINNEIIMKHFRYMHLCQGALQFR